MPIIQVREKRKGQGRRFIERDTDTQPESIENSLETVEKAISYL